MIACAIRQRVERQRSADRFSGRPDRVAGPTGSSTSRNKPDLNSVPVTLESGSGLCYVRTRFSCIFANCFDRASRCSITCRGNSRSSDETGI